RDGEPDAAMAAVADGGGADAAGGCRERPGVRDGAVGPAGPVPDPDGLPLRHDRADRGNWAISVEHPENIAGLEAAPQRGSRRGSNASRTASPMKISKVSTPPRTTNAVMPSHGACRFDFAWATSSPRDGEPGGRPKPRKSSVDSNVTEPDRMNGR